MICPAHLFQVVVAEPVDVVPVADADSSAVPDREGIRAALTAARGRFAAAATTRRVQHRDLPVMAPLTFLAARGAGTQKSLGGTAVIQPMGQGGSRPDNTYILTSLNCFPSPNRSKIAPVCGMSGSCGSRAILEGNRRHLEFSVVKNCILRVLRACGSACGARRSCSVRRWRCWGWR